MNDHTCPSCLSDWTAQIGALPDLALTQWECLRCQYQWWSYDWTEWEEETA